MHSLLCLSKLFPLYVVHFIIQNNNQNPCTSITFSFIYPIFAHPVKFSNLKLDTLVCILFLCLFYVFIDHLHCLFFYIENNVFQITIKIFCNIDLCWVDSHCLVFWTNFDWFALLWFSRNVLGYHEIYSYEINQIRFYSFPDFKMNLFFHHVVHVDISRVRNYIWNESILVLLIFDRLIYETKRKKYSYFATKQHLINNQFMELWRWVWYMFLFW